MIKDKRNSLESFIKEQLIGPGGCGNNFGVYVSNENEKELVCEVLNTTPGSIYSTGILFPRKDNQSLFMSDLNPSCHLLVRPNPHLINFHHQYFHRRSFRILDQT